MKKSVLLISIFALFNLTLRLFYYSGFHYSTEAEKTVELERPLKKNAENEYDETYEFTGSFGYSYDEELYSATIDDQHYTSGTRYTIVGNHVLKLWDWFILKKTYYIILHPKIDNVANGGTYSSPVTPIISDGTLTLDGEPYSSGAPIYESGNHTLMIQGVNDYSKTIKFTVTASSSIQNGATYYGSVTPIINGGSITLDGQPYTSGTPIYESGNHTIVVTGYNWYKTTIQFLLLPSCNITDGSIFVDSVTPEFSDDNYLYYDFNERMYSFNNGTELNAIGNYTIYRLINYVYHRVVRFIIEPSIIGVSNDETYQGSATPIISGGSLTLDGQPYTSGTTIAEPGEHVLTISGINGYLKTINFSISLIDSGISDGDSFINTASYTFSGGSATLDGDSYSSGTEITEIGNHIITVSGSSDYSKTINFTINPDIINLEDGQTYEGSVTPSISGGSITLDGQPYTSGTTITEPGEHSIEISGSNGYKKTINFEVSLIDSGIADGAIYYDSVSYTFSGGSATLDGNSYTSGATISQIGTHTIVVSGSNGFEKTINFEIRAIEYEIESDSNSWTIKVSNIHPHTVVKIDKIIINSYPYVVTEIGNHTLSIINENGYEKIVNFTIDFIDDDLEDGGEYVDSITPNIVGFELSLDGQPYTSGTEINEIGNHSLIVYAANGYEKAINFSIIPNIQNLKNNQTYEGSVTPSISGGSITLDGQPYTSGTTITEPGEHSIEISGSNGYSNTINFSISLADDGIVDGATYYDSVSYTFSGGKVTLDGEPYLSGTTISKIGTHTIVVSGSGSFSKTINFEIKAIEYEIKEDDNSWSIDFSEINPNTIITLDGVQIVDDYTETRIGNHTLVISNSNGYSKTISFTIKEHVSFNDGDSFNNPLVVDGINGQIYVDGVEVQNGYRIDQNGQHTITIVGSNGYKSIYTITYNNPNYNYSFIMITPASLIVVASIFVFVLKRRMK